MAVFFPTILVVWRGGPAEGTAGCDNNHAVDFTSLTSTARSSSIDVPKHRFR